MPTPLLATMPTPLLGPHVGETPRERRREHAVGHRAWWHGFGDYTDRGRTVRTGHQPTRIGFWGFRGIYGLGREFRLF